MLGETMKQSNNSYLSIMSYSKNFYYVLFRKFPLCPILTFPLCPIQTVRLVSHISGDETTSEDFVSRLFRTLFRCNTLSANTCRLSVSSLFHVMFRKYIVCFSVSFSKG